MSCARNSEIWKAYNMKRFLLLFLSLCYLIPTTTLAVDVDDLYSASVEIQGSQNNWKLQRSALSEVLIKVSGSASVTSDPVIRKALSRAKDYLVKQSESQRDDKRFLDASFSEQKINRLIRSSQFGVWGKNRPQLIVWLVVDENFERSIKGESNADYAEFIDTVQQAANTRAVPLLFPIMDLDDELQVTSSDLWGQFTNPVELASARYGADNYIIAKMLKNTDDFQLSWSLYGRNSKSQPFEIWLNGKTQGDLTTIGTSMSSSLANYFGDKYSVKVSGKNELVFLNIDRVNDIKHYAEIMAMFSGLSAVGQADLAAVTGSSVQLKLTLLGNQDDLLKEIELDPRISTVLDTFGDTRFEWANK